MGPPPVQPIGIQVARTAKVVGKAFDDVLVEAGGSLPVWPQNRRIHRVELTAAGEAMFHRLRRAVTAFDARLRKGITATEITVLGDLLTRLRLNVAEDALTEESS
jgi:MarR family transcriptional regulator for hemolysin